MKILFISWQDPLNRCWFPVGRLTYDDSVFRFVYTEGSKMAKNFEPFPGMRNSKIIYESEDLFPIFSNRLLSSSRPEFSKLINWLNLTPAEIDPFVILTLTGGIKQTDSFEIFPCPLPSEDGKYELNFFSRGLSHEPEATQKRADELVPGEKLFVMKDVQNEYDMKALLLRTDDPVMIVGYCPRYLATDLNLLIEKNGPKNLEFSVKKVNQDAPYQLRLLCKVSTPWPRDFKACSDSLYQSLAGGPDRCAMPS